MGFVSQVWTGSVADRLKSSNVIAMLVSSISMCI